MTVPLILAGAAFAILFSLPLLHRLDPYRLVRNKHPQQAKSEAVAAIRKPEPQPESLERAA